MAAGLATLKKAEEQDVYAVLEKRAESFFSSLQALFDKKGAGLQVMNQGSLFWIHRAVEGDLRGLDTMPKNQGEVFRPLFQNLLKQGVYMAPSGYELGFLSLAHDQEVLSAALEAFQQAL